MPLVLSKSPVRFQRNENGDRMADLFFGVLVRMPANRVAELERVIGDGWAF